MTSQDHDSGTDAEEKRLAALRRLAVLDTLPEPVFDAITQAAAEVCGVPIALLSLIDAERQWFKSNHGLTGVTQTPRDVAFCDHAIRNDGLMEVADAATDPRFAGNPLVTGEPRIRFYAGAPIVMPGGERIGTVCVIDHAPRQLTDSQRRTLAGLGRIASACLDDRRQRVAVSADLGLSESRYRAIVEDQTEMISLAQRDGTLAFANSAYARHFGLEPQAMIGRNLIEFVAVEDRAAVLAHLESVCAHGVPAAGVNRMLSAGGQTRWVAWSNRPLADADGHIGSIHSVGRDVTEQHRLAAELERANAHLNAIVDNVPAMLAYWDRHGVNQFANREYQAAVGLPLAKIVGRPLREVYDALDPAGYATVAPHIAEVLQGRRQVFEHAMLTVAGLRQVHMTYVPDRRGTREVAGFYGLAYDITGRKALELRLGESELRYRSLFDNLNSGFALHEIIVDAAGRPVDYRFLAMNRAFGTMTGLDPAASLGRRVTELFPGIENDPADWIGVYGRVAQSGVAMHFEQHAQSLDRWYDIVAYRSAPGQFAVIAHDVTPRKQADARLAQSEQRQRQQLQDALTEKELLLKEVYHRVKNNLQVVQSLLSLQRRSVAEGPARTALDDSVQRVRAMALVHEKLYRSGNLAAVSLPEYTADLLKQLDDATGAAARHIRLTHRIDALQIGLDNAIPYGLLVTELVTNCVKHAFAGRDDGEVCVSLSGTAGAVRLAVTDNGSGVKQGFDLSRCASMGLQLASSLAMQLGGELRLRNEGGAEFSAVLTRL